MASNEVIIRFEDVSFHYIPTKPLLKEVSFCIRRAAKLTLMGQNGAGKSTIFKLITGEIEPEEGSVSKNHDLTVSTAKQMMTSEDQKATIREFFEKAFTRKVYDIDPRIKKVLEIVHLKAPLDAKVGTFSGGQKARLLLAFALIQEPDILLLDEPTNNLDKAGIAHLKQFIINYGKTCVVISHDADFLNAFTEGVLYLDAHSHKVEQYVGNYTNVVEEISRRIERERMQNVRLEKDIQNRKDQANFFAQKGGHMRDVAKKMRTKVEQLEENKVEMREEDKTIRNFRIPCEENLEPVVVAVKSVSIVKDHKPVTKKINISIKKGDHLLLQGPNGIGKTTLLESIAKRTAKGVEVGKEVTIGYYRQDFGTLDFDQTAYETLKEVAHGKTEEELRSLAAGFLLTSEILKHKVGNLSEGQKGLLSFARLVFLAPGLLLIDEPTNHINFRHIPVIAQALDKYEGTMILISHVPSFVKQIRIDQTLDLESL